MHPAHLHRNYQCAECFKNSLLEPIENQYKLIGHVNRSHGVHGEVLILSEVNAPNLFDEVDLLWLQNGRGDLIPARVESVRAEEKQDQLSFFVKFEHVADRSRAEALKGYPVYADREIAERLTVVTDQPTDYATFDLYDEQDQHIGKVESVIDNPAHPILQVATDDDRQLLIPFVDEYVLSSDEEEKIIRCRNLDQLEDL